MILTSAFYVAEPEKLPIGVCTRCGGWRPGWGAGYSGLACVTTQHAGGEVRNAVCGRCHGSGVEPAKFYSTAVWYKPWTWLSGDWIDYAGRCVSKPKAQYTEEHP